MNADYDQLNRIKQADEGPVGNTAIGRWGQSYTIDPWGNLSNIALTKGTASTLSVTIGTNNRFTTRRVARPKLSMFELTP